MHNDLSDKRTKIRTESLIKCRKHCLYLETLNLQMLSASLTECGVFCWFINFNLRVAICEHLFKTTEFEHFAPTFQSADSV